MEGAECGWQEAINARYKGKGVRTQPNMRWTRRCYLALSEGPPIGSTPGMPTRSAVLPIACTRPCRLLISFEAAPAAHTLCDDVAETHRQASNEQRERNRPAGVLDSSPMNDAVSQPPKANVSTDQKMMSFRRTLGIMVCSENVVADP